MYSPRANYERGSLAFLLLLSTNVLFELSLYSFTVSFTAYFLPKTSQTYLGFISVALVQKMTAWICDGACVGSEFYQHTSAPPIKFYSLYFIQEYREIQTESYYNNLESFSYFVPNLEPF